MIDKRELYNDIQCLYSKLGYVNRKELEKYVTKYNVGFQLSKYGGLRAICKELNIEYRQYSRIEPEEIRKDYLKVYSEHGNISADIYLKYGKYSRQAIKTAFGGITNLMNQLDIPLNIHFDVKKEDVVYDVKKFISNYKTVSSTKYRKYGNYSQTVIDNLFGSWSELLHSIGVPPICEKIGFKKMITDVSELYDEYGFLSTRLINDNCCFTYQALSQYVSMDEISKILKVNNAFKKSKSTHAYIIENIVKSLYQDTVTEYSPKWLINSKTGNKMYIDFYIPSKKTAIEYDGEQHFKYNTYFFKNYKQFYLSVYRDREKEKLLRLHHIKLIRIKYDEDITKEHIISRINNI